MVCTKKNGVTKKYKLTTKAMVPDWGNWKDNPIDVPNTNSITWICGYLSGLIELDNYIIQFGYKNVSNGSNYDNYIYYRKSYDGGLTWENPIQLYQFTSQSYSYANMQVAYGNNKFVIIICSTSVSVGDTKIISTSDLQNVSVVSKDYRDYKLIFGGGIFAIFYGNVTRSYIYKSTDGVTWTQDYYSSTSSFYTTSTQGVVYVNGYFYSLWTSYNSSSSSHTNYVYIYKSNSSNLKGDLVYSYSKSGQTSTSISAQAIYYCEYSNKFFVVTNTSGVGLLTTNNTSTLQQVDANYRFYSLWGNDKYLMLGNMYTQAYKYSNDGGNTWYDGENFHQAFSYLPDINKYYSENKLYETETLPQTKKYTLAIKKNGTTTRYT